jgi:hypothetical protein
VERSEEKRSAYRKQIAEVPDAKRVYVDESGIHKFCFRRYARSLRGERVYGLVPGKKFHRVNVVAGYRDGKILGAYCYNGTTTAQVFEDWFCRFLLPETRKGDVVVLDNARFHNKERLRAYACVYKVTIIFLPPYSPDYNRIEKVWANLKRFLGDMTLEVASLQAAIYWYLAVRYS